MATRADLAHLEVGAGVLGHELGRGGHDLLTGCRGLARLGLGALAVLGGMRHPLAGRAHPAHALLYIGRDIAVVEDTHNNHSFCAILTSGNM